jgi:hypothetical protein
MRTTFFFLAMFASVAASAQVTNVEPVGANYTNKTVSFRVWWNAGSRDATHLAKVWVWVDYITVNSNNTTSGNSWTRATVGSVSGGVTSYDGSYRSGFWLEGNASTNYSATVTVQLTNVPAKFNWCAYVSDYPPNVTAANGTYTFKGTPPFTLIAANGTTSQAVTGTTLATSALTITPTTIRDKTECPGVFCIYSGSDLYIDATHHCQQRITGAQNWEAWIKDSRDNELYRIVLMPDNKWWLAQNLKYAQTGTQPSWCTKDECGRYYTAAQARASSGTGANKQGVCPNNWVIPVYSNFQDILTAYSNNMAQQCTILTPMDSRCAYNDFYGLCTPITASGVGGDKNQCAAEMFIVNDCTGCNLQINDMLGASNFDCGYWHYETSTGWTHYIVRCIRQL